MTSKRSGGFTLVELLLALTLMSMLLAMTYGGLRAATRAADRGQDVLEESGQIRMAQLFIRRQLSQMLPLAFSETVEDEERTVFEGNTQRIRFVSSMPGYLGFGGPQVQELAFVQGEDGMDLVLSHAPLQGFEEIRLNDRDPVVLLSHISDGGFRFIDMDEDQQLTSWMSTWDEVEKIPLSVAVDLTFTDEIYLEWPVLNASPRIDSNAVARMAGVRSMNQNYSDSIRRLIDRRSEGQQ